MGNLNELYHHGILGMKWGQRNGPPYPLGARNHSASEKKAGWRKSLDTSGKKADNKAKLTRSTKANSKPKSAASEPKKGLTSGQKKAIAIGAATVAAGLAAYGAYKLGGSDALDQLVGKGKRSVEQLLGNSSVANRNVGSMPDGAFKTLGRNETIREAVAKVNPSGSNTNCRACSIASILRMRGLDVEALGSVQGGSLREAVETCFKDAKVVEVYSPTKERVTNYILKHYGEGASGVLGAEFAHGANGSFEHATSWTVKGGAVSFFDGQKSLDDVSWLLDKISGAKAAEICRIDDLQIDSDGIQKFIKIR